MKNSRAILALCSSAALAAAAVTGGHNVRGAIKVADARPVSIERKGRAAHPHSEEAEEPTEVQHEVERMMSRVNKLDDAGAESAFAGKLERIEAELYEQRKKMDQPEEDKQLSDEINTERANLCVEQGFSHQQSDDCESFMMNACHFTGGSWTGAAGKRTMIPHVTLHVSASSAMTADVCKRFFVESTREAIEGMVVSASSNSSNSSNSTGLFGGKKIRGLPEHGYNEYGEGKMVEHTDDTMTQDWQKEHGASSGSRDAEDICAEFPDNEWCRIHGHHKHNHRQPSAPEPEPAPPRPRRSAAVSGQPVHFVFGSLAALVLAQTL